MATQYGDTYGDTSLPSAHTPRQRRAAIDPSIIHQPFSSLYIYLFIYLLPNLVRHLTSKANKEQAIYGKSNLDCLRFPF